MHIFSEKAHRQRSSRKVHAWSASVSKERSFWHSFECCRAAHNTFHSKAGTLTCRTWNGNTKMKGTLVLGFVAAPIKECWWVHVDFPLNCVVFSGGAIWLVTVCWFGYKLTKSYLVLALVICFCRRVLVLQSYCYLAACLFCCASVLTWCACKDGPASACEHNTASKRLIPLLGKQLPFFPYAGCIAVLDCEWGQCNKSYDTKLWGERQRILFQQL